jgi:hypothetical protein
LIATDLNLPMLDVARRKGEERGHEGAPAPAVPLEERTAPHRSGEDPRRRDVTAFRQR